MARSNPDLDQLSDDELLDICLCDLKLQIKGTSLEPAVEQLNEELRSRGIGFRPHYWLSDDWYSPDGIPASQFRSICAPRLARLERKQLFEVEAVHTNGV